jgi:hypothetical protein
MGMVFAGELEPPIAVTVAVSVAASPLSIDVHDDYALFGVGQLGALRSSEGSTR